jgi:hypothetical protein
MEETRMDSPGDFFEGGITYDEAGQFFTAECACRLMTASNVDDIAGPNIDART